MGSCASLKLDIRVVDEPVCPPRDQSRIIEEIAKMDHTVDRSDEIKLLVAMNIWMTCLFGTRIEQRRLVLEKRPDLSTLDEIDNFIIIVKKKMCDLFPGQ